MPPEQKRRLLDPELPRESHEKHLHSPASEAGLHAGIRGVRVHTGNVLEQNDQRVFIGDGEFGKRKDAKPLHWDETADREGDMHDTRELLAHRAEKMNNNLDRLSQRKDAVSVLGEGWNAAFPSREEIENGTVVLHCGCMDERVPDTEGGLKIGTAGSGILMTRFDDPRFEGKKAEDIYAFLADPASGDGNFAALVSSLRAMQAKGATINVSDHGGCGAAGMFCARFEGKDLDPAKAARAAATRLQRALGLQGMPSHTDYGDADIPMNGDPHVHDAHCLIIDATGRFRADAVKDTLRGLKLSGMTMLPDAESDEQNGYLRTELAAGTGIIAGSHGVGLKNAPIVVILDPADPRSRETVQKRYDLAAQGDRRIHYVTAPVKS